MCHNAQYPRTPLAGQFPDGALNGFLWQTSVMMRILFRTTRFSALAPAFFVGWTLPIVLAISVSPLSAQAPSSKRLAHVTVTDPLGRFVTGIEQERFEIVENGVRRPITDFSDVDSPISLAIVSETPLAASSLYRPNDELIQTRSIADALRQLSASKNPRKALVVTTTTDTQAIRGVQVVQANPDNLLKAVVELRNQYLLQFESANTSANLEVVLHQPRGLPPLRPNLK
jgi:hypothetical protein